MQMCPWIVVISWEVADWDFGGKTTQNMERSENILNPHGAAFASVKGLNVQKIKKRPCSTT